jgi:hypothetical protein
VIIDGLKVCLPPEGYVVIPQNASAKRDLLELAQTEPPASNGPRTRPWKPAFPDENFEIAAHCTSISVLALIYDFITSCTVVFHWLSVSILFVFLLEELLLFFGYGLKFFKKWMYVLDTFIVVSSIVVDVLYNLLPFLVKCW